MNKYVIVDNKPYLLFNGKAYGVRRNDEGFTVGKEVELSEMPTRTYSEVTINAKYKKGYDSIVDLAEESTLTDVEPMEEAGEIKDTIISRDGEDLIIPEEVSDAKEKEELEHATMEELRIYAKQHGIELNGARSKAAIIKAIVSEK